MASRPQSKAIGGVTPLGAVTITAGTPVQISSLLAVPTTNPGATKTDPIYALTARQIGFSVAASPAGVVYVNYGNYPGLDVNATALIIASGTQQSLPAGTAATEGLIDCSKWWIDASANCVVALYVLDASS